MKLVQMAARDITTNPGEHPIAKAPGGRSQWQGKDTLHYIDCS